MSRSYHQRHPLSHNKKNRFPYPHVRKMKPHGLVHFAGYGDEVYIRRLGEIYVPTICKRQERKKIDINNIDEY